MYTLLICFVLSFIIAILLWAFGKINEAKIALILFVSAICFLILPAMVEKEVATAGMEIRTRFIDAEVFYQSEENKYYALYEKENSFVFWDLYDLKEIDETVLKEKESNRTATTRLLK